jgi:NADH dehydrogenase FAD-containing subunit
MDGEPRPKSGVYAVRAGPPLAANLRAALEGRPLAPYRPQPRALALIGTGGKHAVGLWGPLSWQGRWVWTWKDRIDRAFVARFTEGYASA